MFDIECIARRLPAYTGCIKKNTTSYKRNIYFLRLYWRILKSQPYFTQIRQMGSKIAVCS